MALIDCIECGHQVSTTAIRCPSCGAMPKPAKRGLISRMVSTRYKCLSCGDVNPGRRAGWSFGALLLLLLLFVAGVVPGIIYGIWRDYKARRILCVSCKGDRTIKV